MIPDSEKLTAAVAAAFPGARSVQVEQITRLTGGASRETWSFDAIIEDDAGLQRQGMILRLGRSEYGDALGAGAAAEYAFYNTLSASDKIPVPRPIAYVADDTLFGSDFFITERIDHCETSPALLDSPAYQGVAALTVKEIFRLGGELTRFPWQGTALADRIEVAAPEQVWRQQLDYWSGVIAACATEPQPLVHYLIHWLRANPPPAPERVVVLSGDFRVGNFLYDVEGRVRGWLDWEMGHLGDPLEDLAWALLSNWRAGEHFPGGLGKEELIREWEAASGLTADPESLRWWSLFQHVKAHGIWQAAVGAVAQNLTSSVKHLVIAACAPQLQDSLLIDEMRWRS